MENFKNSPFVKKVGFNRIVLCGVLLSDVHLYSHVTSCPLHFLSYSRIFKCT